MNCYDFTGAAVATPPGLANIFLSGGTGSVIFPPLNLTVGGGLRSYLPFYTGQRVSRKHALLRLDRSGGLPGFPLASGHPSVNGGDTYDYGYVSTTACLYGIGDRRYLFNVDPVTGVGEC